MCAACAAYERLTALFGVCGVGWRQLTQGGAGDVRAPAGGTVTKE